MLRRERLCDDDEEITRGGEERADMEIWWCWLLRAAVPLNVHISLSLSRRTPSLFKSSSHRVSLSPFIVYPLSPPPSLPCPLSLSQCVCAYLSIWMDGRAHWHVFCVHTHILCVSTMCSLVWPLAAAASSNLMRARSQLRAAHITHQCTVVVVVLLLLLHNNIYI